ncbi:MAG TPA: glucose-6-phosphate dehydrogenase assembly protein OpcA [Bryobacteraceae bacterium]|nr:glucose-6-phosphate dehydrogenase assembly protein OpcA [Bryobacteraceae bacterium]
MEAAVRPERILKDLRGLWVDLGKDEPAGVLRACAMTLVVVVEEERDAAAIGETIASFIHEHPSRAIVLRVRAGDESALSARVFAQCWMPFGSRQQICCEQVEIISSVASFADATSVLRGLVVPDLPVVVYCPSEALWPTPEFLDLLPLCSKVIVDSHAMERAPSALSYLQSLSRTAGFRKADLMWARITPWREAIAQIFEDPARMRCAFDLEEIQILYRSDLGEPSSVYYLAGWFMSVLGAGVKIRIAPGVGPEYAGIAHVTITGPKIKATVDLTTSDTVDVSVNGEHLQMTVFPPATETDALRQELAIANRDTRFEDALGLGQLMYQGGQP